jgi:hypothetical protein
MAAMPEAVLAFDHPRNSNSGERKITPARAGQAGQQADPGSAERSGPYRRIAGLAVGPEPLGPQQPGRAEQQHDADDRAIVGTGKLDCPADESHGDGPEKERPQHPPAEHPGVHEAPGREARDKDVQGERRWPHDGRSDPEQRHKGDVGRRSRVADRRVENRPQE